MDPCLLDIERLLFRFISPSVIRCLSRSAGDDCIILTARSSNTLSICLFSDMICINYADEYEEFDICSKSKLLSTLDTVGSFINELVTGVLIYEKVYYGTVQTKCRVVLSNKVTKRRINLRDTVVTSNYPTDKPRLVIHENIYFY